MADKYTQAQGLFNQGLGVAARIEQNNKELLLKQMQEMFEQSKSRIDLGFKTMKEAKNANAKQAIWNSIVPDFGIVAPDMKIGQVDMLDEPTTGALEAMSILYESGGLKALNDFAPKIIAEVSRQSGGDKEQVGMAQEFLDRAMKLEQSQFDRNAPEGAPFETVVDGKNTLGRTNKQNEFIPITTGKQTVEKPPEKLPAEAAGKVSTSQRAIQQLDELEKLIFSSKTDSGKATANKGAIIGAKFNLPTDKARLIKKNIEAVIDSKLRNESGATITTEERQKEIDKYAPGAFDSDRVIRAKIDDLRDIAENFIYTVDPNGKLKLTREGNTEAPQTDTQPTGKIKTAEDYLKKFQQGK